MHSERGARERRRRRGGEAGEKAKEIKKKKKRRVEIGRCESRAPYGDKARPRGVVEGTTYVSRGAGRADRARRCRSRETAR